ncbi:DUF5133 domain-containing protein [Streptomyces lydicus]|uniref:DUF5133 domain-containing protein n=1 Tax=Streptomyces lydicus TaxID=47763 RepID=UPI001013A196|nr:DUF5133 domain-containing protein [Streptomyces lydicus]MCZ1005639.1 DUF5133 domain-containing protein [Streptomyces lydicus]
MPGVGPRSTRTSATQLDEVSYTLCVATATTEINDALAAADRILAQTASPSSAAREGLRHGAAAARVAARAHRTWTGMAHGGAAGRPTGERVSSRACRIEQEA